jgi:hypothetical protein
MGNRKPLKLAIFIFSLLLFSSLAFEPASASVSLKNVKTWYWMDDTKINSVISGDVDSDGVIETVTGGTYWNSSGYNYVAQLCVWDSTNLAVERFTNWYWASNTVINSVALGDVDGDSQIEIITGGYYYDGSRDVAQLCIWDGATLTLERVKNWYWISYAAIHSVALGDVDSDGQIEIVTGGIYGDLHAFAQLCIWNGANLEIENVKSWVWAGSTYILSVALGDVDSDGQIEIVTGGYYDDDSQFVAQLVVWNGATMALESVKTWQWTSITWLDCVVVGDVDVDSEIEIVTGGYYYGYDGPVAQLCVWNGTNLALESVETWQWTSYTEILDVVVGNVDDDSAVEIVTGGYYTGSSGRVAQLCVWNGTNLALESVKTWQWTSDTKINSVAVGNVDGDSQVEIVTGGYCNDGSREAAQLVVWGL